MEYPGLSTLQIATPPKTIKTINYDNSQGTVEQEFEFAGSESVMTSESWSVTAGMEAGVETEVKAGFPILAEGKVTVSVKLSVSDTYQRSTTKTTDKSFTHPLKVPVGQHLQATATLYEGNIDTKYTASMVYTLDTGETFRYNVSGTYTGVSVSEIVVSVVQLKHDK